MVRAGRFDVRTLVEHTWSAVARQEEEHDQERYRGAASSQVRPDHVSLEPHSAPDSTNRRRQSTPMRTRIERTRPRSSLHYARLSDPAEYELGRNPDADGQHKGERPHPNRRG